MHVISHQPRCFKCSLHTEYAEEITCIKGCPCRKGVHEGSKKDGQREEPRESLKPRCGHFSESWERTHQFIPSANTYCTQSPHQAPFQTLWIQQRENNKIPTQIRMPGLGRSPGKENGNLLQYSCLKNSRDRGAMDSQSLGLQRIRHN